MSVTELHRARWAQAESCNEVSAVDTLMEAASAIREGEINAKSVIVIALVDGEDGVTHVELFNGGPANTNERLGMFVRAQQASLRVWDEA